MIKFIHYFVTFGSKYNKKKRIFLIILGGAKKNDSQFLYPTTEK